MSVLANLPSLEVSGQEEEEFPPEEVDIRVNDPIFEELYPPEPSGAGSDKPTWPVPERFSATSEQDGWSRKHYADYAEQALHAGSHDALLLTGIAEPEEVLKCARTLVNAMAIPDEYWKRWMQSVYMLATSFDIMQQLVHAGQPMVKSVRDINSVKPEILKKPTCMMLDNKWHADNRPSVKLKCAKAGEMQYGADGRSLFIKTESGKWLAVANTDGRPFKLSQELADEAQTSQWDDTFTQITGARALEKLAGQAYPPASSIGRLGAPALRFSSA